MRSTTMNQSIHTIYWGEISHSSASKMIAIWPGPVNHDECFMKAGFSDFQDTDEQWDTEFENISKKLIELLSEFGTPRLRQGESPKVSFTDKLLSKIGLRKIPSFSIIDTLIFSVHFSTHDDNVKSCIIDFGSAATLQTSDGHPLWWVCFLREENSEGLLNKISQGRVLKKIQLDWSVLIPN